MGPGKLEKLTMPKWGLSMTKGKVVAWLVDEGAPILAGNEVVEVETEKIVSIVESPAAGVLRRQVAKVGDDIPVAGLLGVIGDAEVPDEQIDHFVETFSADAIVDEAPVDEPSGEAIEVDGRTLRYFMRGSEGTPVVLIHGLGGDLNNWLFNHESLAAGRPVVTLDLPGHGGSSKDVADGSIGSLAKTVGGLMDAIGVERAHLVGHSLGGAIALELASSRPERALSITLIGSAGLGPDINGAYVDGFIAAARRTQLKPVLQELFAEPGLVTRQMVEDVLKFKRLDGVQEALTKIAGQLIRDGKQAASYRDRLGEIGVPILAIWGAQDRIIPAAHAEGLPGAASVHVLENCGHMVQMEAAAQVNRLIDEFVDRS